MISSLFLWILSSIRISLTKKAVPPGETANSIKDYTIDQVWEQAF